MRTFAELQAENRRCAFLRFLAEDPDYAMNTSLLQSALEVVGHGVSRDCVDADCGRAVVPGVKRPGPRP